MGAEVTPDDRLWLHQQGIRYGPFHTVIVHGEADLRDVFHNAALIRLDPATHPDPASWRPDVLADLLVIADSSVPMLTAAKASLRPGGLLLMVGITGTLTAVRNLLKGWKSVDVQQVGTSLQALAVR